MTKEIAALKEIEIQIAKDHKVKFNTYDLEEINRLRNSLLSLLESEYTNLFEITDKTRIMLFDYAISLEVNTEEIEDTSITLTFDNNKTDLNTFLALTFMSIEPSTTSNICSVYVLYYEKRYSPNKLIITQYKMLNIIRLLFQYSG